jgi:hypothetical protein
MVPKIKYSDFGEVLKIDKWLFQVLKSLLHTTGAQIPA